MKITEILKHYDKKNGVKSLKKEKRKVNELKKLIKDMVKKWNVWFAEKRRNILRNVPDAIKLVAPVVMKKEYVLIVWLKRYVRVKGEGGEMSIFKKKEEQKNYRIYSEDPFKRYDNACIQVELKAWYNEIKYTDRLKAIKLARIFQKYHRKYYERWGVEYVDKCED